MIIDACSREGEPLWQLSSTSYSMIPYSYSVIPYLVFATIGHFGVQGRDGIQFTSENPLYKLWHDGLLNADQVFFSPQHKPAGKICVNALIKENDTLMIVLKHKKQDVYFEGKEFCIEFGGKKFPAIDFYSDRWIHKNYYPSLMVIKFAVHNDLPEMFDLVFYNKKGKEKLSIRDIVFRK